MKNLGLEDIRINLACKKRIIEISSTIIPYGNKAWRPDNNFSINTDLFFKGEKLKLFIVDPDDFVIINQAYELLKEFFVRGEELVGLNTIIRNMHGLSKHFTERPEYRLFVVQNSNNKIIGVRIVEQIPVLGKPDENIIYAIYIAVDKKYQGLTGIAKQLYVSSLVDAVFEAEKAGKKINCIVAECSDATENLQNSVGLKRVYFKEGTILRELNFKQPYISFNPINGYPTEVLGKENKDHFMIGFLESEIKKENLSFGVLSLFKKYQSNKIEADFKDKKAFNNYVDYFKKLEDEILEQINSDGELVSLSKTERLLYQNLNGDDSVISHKNDNGID